MLRTWLEWLELMTHKVYNITWTKPNAKIRSGRYKNKGGTNKQVCKNINIKPEDLAHWYFRLNGVFTIPNFIVHEEDGGGQRTDVDIFGVRFPYRAELMENAMEDDVPFIKKTKPYIIIAEVKKGRCHLNGPWRDPSRENMPRILCALGAFPLDKNETIADHLYKNGFYGNEQYVISLFCVGNSENQKYKKSLPKVPQITWEHIAKFIYNRFFRHTDQKSRHPQWDQTGQILWRIFMNCCGKPDGRHAYTKKILNWLGP